jgi:hypothetical protein
MRSEWAIEGRSQAGAWERENNEYSIISIRCFSELSVEIIA